MHAYRTSEDYRLLRRRLRQLWVSAFSLVGALVVAVVGFVWVEQYSLLDAVYMAIITISTVGYHEVQPLTDSGKAFASVMIVTNISIFAYFVSSISQLFFEGRLRHSLRIYRMQQRIDKLTGHTIVVGYGRIGHRLVEELEREGRPFVLIDNRSQLVQEFADGAPGRYYLLGDGTDEDTLQRAGISRAKSLVTTLPKDADNVYVVLTAKSLNANLNAIARASEGNAIAKLKRSGADHVVWPEQVGGQFMAYIVTKPDIYEFIGLLNAPGGQGVYFTEVKGTDLKPEYVGSTLQKMATREQSGASLIGLKTVAGEYFVNPPLETIVESTCRLVVLGNADQLTRFTQQFLQPEVQLERY